MERRVQGGIFWIRKAKEKRYHPKVFIQGLLPMQIEAA
jgi:hypothetical protein